MIVQGVISTVPWRRESFNRTMESLAAQDRKPDSMLVIYDGKGHEWTAQRRWHYKDLTGPYSHGVNETINGTTKGAWNRVVEGWSQARSHGATLLAVFDDDIVYPPDYLECMIKEASDNKYKKHIPVALGGTDLRWKYHSYWTSSAEEILLIEPNMGASVWPVNLGLDRLVENDDVASEIVSMSGDTAVGYALWRSGLFVIKPKGNFIALPDRCAWDERSLYMSRGGSNHVWRVRKKLYERTGWPGSPVPEIEIPEIKICP